MSKCISPHIFLLARVKILMDNGAAPKPGHSEWKRASRDFFPCARLVSPFVLSIFAPPINRPRPLDIEQTICALVIIANSIHLAVFSDMQIKTFVLQNLGMCRCRCSNGTCLFLERFLLPTEHEYPMISEIEVGICNFKWTKSVPIQQIKTFPLFAKELIIDMHFKLQRLRKKHLVLSGWSKWKRPAQSPQLGMFHYTQVAPDWPCFSVAHSSLDPLGSYDPHHLLPGPWNHGLFFQLFFSPRSAYDAAFAGGPQVEETPFFRRWCFF